MTDEYWKCRHGSIDVALDNEFARVLVGSTTHGLAVGGDDRDYTGICIEPPEYVTGLSRFDTAVLRTQPEGVRSGAGDVDLTIYSMRHLARLLAAGNPTLLLLLWAPMEAVQAAGETGGWPGHWFGALQSSRHAFLHRGALLRFLGYLDGQLERMQGGGKQNRVPNRPELIEEFGYDTKYAMHALRLGLQGVELAETHELTLPMREADREACLEIRRGHVTQDEALGQIRAVRSRLLGLIEHPPSPLVTGVPPMRDEPDWPYIHRWLTDVHLEHWYSHRMLGTRWLVRRPGLETKGVDVENLV